MPNTVSRDRAAAFYNALATRDPDRIAPFLDDDVDWLLVGPVELFAYCGQHVGKAAVLDVFHQIGQSEHAHGNVRDFLLVDDDCAAALTRLRNTEIRTGREINFRVAHFARFRNSKVIEYCGMPDSLGKIEQTLGHPLDMTMVPTL